MSRNDHRAAGAFAAALLCMGILSWGKSTPLNVVAGAPLVLYLPGWAVLRALAAEPDDRFERAMLRVALSLAIVVVIGLLLHPVNSITRAGWLTTLGVTILAACVVSLIGEKRQAVARPAADGPRLASCRPTHVAAAASAIGLAAAAVALSVVVTSSRHEFNYTQAWIVPKRDAPDQVVLGLRNEEAHGVSYAIELLVDRHLVQSWSEISLKPGETWTTTFRWVGFGEYPRAIQPLKESTIDERASTVTVVQRVGLGAAPRVEALVYRSSNRSVIYRHVWSAPQCVTNNDAHGRPPCAS
jgi:uncharacterized membrane protein